MTSNSLKYLELQEKRRNNQQNELINLAQTTENIRHNVATERYNAWAKTLDNAIDWSNIGIASRNAQTNAVNAMTNSVNSLTRQRELAENQRHNIAMESETQRHQSSVEQIQALDAETRKRVADKDIVQSWLNLPFTQSEKAASAAQSRSSAQLNRSRQSETDQNTSLKSKENANYWYSQFWNNMGNAGRFIGSATR